MGLHTMLCLSKTHKTQRELPLMRFDDLVVCRVLSSRPNDDIIHKRVGTITYGL